MNIKRHLYITNPVDFIKGNYDHCFVVSTSPDLGVGGWVYAGLQELTVKADIANVTSQTVAHLEAEKVKEQDEHTLKMTILDHQINDLLCIGYQPEPIKEADFPDDDLPF